MAKIDDQTAEELLKVMMPNFLMKSPFTMKKAGSCIDCCGPCECFGAPGAGVDCKSAGAAGGVLGCTTA